MIVRFAKLVPNAKIPTKKFELDAGYDLYSSVDVTIEPHSSRIINTGITVEIPDGLFARILPKSRSNFLIGAGVIESNYQGEILVKIVNFSNDTLIVNKGDPIAQLVFHLFIVTQHEEVSKDEIHKVSTDRGATGGIVSALEKENATKG
jgi:dUTP pyrophosphatase